MCDFVIPIAIGVTTALTLPPLPTGFLSPITLSILLIYVVASKNAFQGIWRMWLATTAMITIHLWWMTTFLGNIFHSPLLGSLAFLLYVIEGSFFAILTWITFKLASSSKGRVWILVGGWGLLEYLRFLGPFAFPWPTIGYSFLLTPFIQIADIGGVLLVSALILLFSGSLANWLVDKKQWKPIILSVFFGITAFVYGITRLPNSGVNHPIKVVGTNFSAFGRASGNITPEQQLKTQLNLSKRQSSNELVVWSETALRATGTVPENISAFPGPGISGLSVNGTSSTPNLNVVVAIDAGGNVVGENKKAKLVPFGEYFPLYDSLPYVYKLIEDNIGFKLENFESSNIVSPISLYGVKYGAYICYDSIFPWVARSLTNKGAKILVNPSNDGWYEGWGIQQHFWMGRVRAIEQRRWLIRSVNKGIMGAVDDLGRPQDIRYPENSAQSLDLQSKLIESLSFYARIGDSPAILAFLVMILFGLISEKKLKRSLLSSAQVKFSE